MKKVEANSRICNLGIWDTAGQVSSDLVIRIPVRATQFHPGFSLRR